MEPEQLKSSHDPSFCFGSLVASLRLVGRRLQVAHSAQRIRAPARPVAAAAATSPALLIVGQTQDRYRHASLKSTLASMCSLEGVAADNSSPLHGPRQGLHSAIQRSVATLSSCPCFRTARSWPRVFVMRNTPPCPISVYNLSPHLLLASVLIATSRFLSCSAYDPCPT